MKAINKMLKYLIYIKSYEIVFNNQAININFIFFDSSDASFANDLRTRHNSQEYCFKLLNKMIDWKASKEKTIIISSIEAKLLIIFMTANIKMWWDRFFEVIAFQISFTRIECDNRQIIRAFTALGASFSIKLRHVNIHRHWLRQEVQNERIIIQWTPSNTILTDGLIKMLSSQRHKEFIRLIGLKNILITKDELRKAKEEVEEDDLKLG